MEAMTTKEFFERMSTDNLVPACIITGLAKKSDKQGEILFAFKHDLSNWMRIPESLIESTEPLKNIPDENGTMILTKLMLKAPTSPESKLYYSLLSVLADKVNSYQKKKWMKKLMWGEKSGMAGWKHCCMKDKCSHHMG